MVEQWTAALVVVFAVGYAVFQAQPQPPQSPLLYQWETMHAHVIKFEGYDIFYKDVDGLVKNSDTLLVLHGFPTSSFDFHLLQSSLRKTFGRVIFIDFLGHGFSDKPRNHVYSLREQTSIVEHVLRKIDVSEFHILSHDYGGGVTLELLTKRWSNPSGNDYSVKSVGIISPSIFCDAYRETWYMYLLRMPVVGYIAARLGNRVSYAQELDHMFGSRKVDESTVKQLWFFARYKDEYRAWPSILSFITERPSLENRWLETLQKASIPVCFIHGPADPILPYQELQALYNERLPRVNVQILSETIGHYPQLEAPEELFEKYAHFLKFKVGLAVPEVPTIVVMPQEISSAFSESY